MMLPEPTPCFCAACDGDAETVAVLWGMRVPFCLRCVGATYRGGTWRCPTHGNAPPIGAEWVTDYRILYPRQLRSGRVAYLEKWEEA